MQFRNSLSSSQELHSACLLVHTSPLSNKWNFKISATGLFHLKSTITQNSLFSSAAETYCRLSCEVEKDLFLSLIGPLPNLLYILQDSRMLLMGPPATLSCPARPPLALVEGWGMVSSLAPCAAPVPACSFMSRTNLRRMTHDTSSHCWMILNWLDIFRIVNNISPPAATWADQTTYDQQVEES